MFASSRNQITQFINMDRCDACETSEPPEQPGVTGYPVFYPIDTISVVLACPIDRLSAHHRDFLHLPMIMENGEVPNRVN